MKPAKSLDFCYDFPRVVLHRPECPRYTGGVCHPLETPTEPYTSDEAKAVKSYAELIDGIDEELVGHELAQVAAAKVHGKVFRASGQTAEPVGVTPDPRVQELLDLGMNYDEAVGICADPRYAGVLTLDMMVELLIEEQPDRKGMVN